MKHKAVYDNCKYLVLKYGYTDGGSSIETVSEGVYVDPCDCDLQIRYSRLPYSVKNGKVYETVEVYLGGRMVYCYDAWIPERENFVKGNWYDLVFALKDDYYTCSASERRILKEHTLMQLCKEEARRNRETFDKYFAMCSNVARSYGRKIMNDTYVFYHYEKRVDENIMKIELREGAYRTENDSNSLGVAFGGKTVFSYRWGGPVGSFWDNKGFYEVGYWENVIQIMCDSV